MKKNYLISIIITCYNNGAYIKECIDSVVNNDEVEIIIINDGSTDNSLNIIDEYNNIKVITTNNNGLSIARNRGIDESTGDYILFIDGDDYIDKHSINIIKNYINDNDFDLLLLNTTKYYEFNNTYEKEILSINNEILDIPDLINNKICGRAWRFLYKSELIKNNNLYFQEKLVYEDEEWVPKVIYYAKKIKYLDIPYYFYRKSNNSITSNKTLNNIKDLIKIVDITYKWNNEIKWNNIYLYFSLSRCIKNIISSINYLDNYDYINDWYKNNKKMINDILQGNKRLRICIKVFGIRKGINIYRKYFKLKNKIKKINVLVK